MNETIFLRATFSRWRKEKKCRMSCSFFLKFSFRYLPNETPTAEVQPRVRSRNDGIYSAVATAVHQKMVEANSHASTGSGFWWWLYRFRSSSKDGKKRNPPSYLSTLYRKLPQGDVSRPDIYHPYWGETRKELAREISASHPTQPNPKNLARLWGSQHPWPIVEET